MSQFDERDQQGSDSKDALGDDQTELAQDEEEEQAPTPFDHPLFLPVLLSGLTLWFGYDGFINQDPDMLEHLTFNRVGFAVLLVAAAYYGFRGYKEWKEDAEN
jgi:hypothetical protein